MLEPLKDLDFRFLREFATVGAALGVDTKQCLSASYAGICRRWARSSSPCSVRITDQQRSTCQTSSSNRRQASAWFRGGFL